MVTGLAPAFNGTIVRYVQSRITTALQDTRVVLVVGPRQAGKTTLARLYANSDLPYITLDDPAALLAAKSDPAGFVRGLSGAVIDEVQRAPDLLLAIKESVDTDQAPGRFLLTGSNNLMTLPIVADSLAGRLAVVTLLPFAQAEMAGTPGDLLERLFAGAGLPGVTSPVTGDALMDRVLRGGYPEALRRTSASRRQAWLEDYVALILDRDVRDIANIDQLDRMPRLLDVLAAHAGQLVNHASYGAALGLIAPTAQKYVGILERLFLLRWRDDAPAQRHPVALACDHAACVVLGGPSLPDGRGAMPTMRCRWQRRRQLRRASIPASRPTGRAATRSICASSKVS